jgi:hypothetical protein
MSDIHPAPENELIYRPVRPEDPDIRKLAESIKKIGLLDPIVITRDHWILSGHRRFAACHLAGMERIQCRIADISRDDPEFLPQLREYNRQRVKGLEEVLREKIVTQEPGRAYHAMLEHRAAQSAVDGAFLQIEGRKVRNRIGRLKRPMLDAACKQVNTRRRYWPTSDRKIHYALLNDPPLRNANRPDSRYRNDKPDYSDLTDILTRGRLFGFIPFHAICDPTRTVCLWQVCRDVSAFVERELEGFLDNYWRDLQQSQPNQIEIIGEKNTVESSIRPVAMKYCIPYTLGRGYCSLDPRKRMYDRFKSSGKDKLIILVLSDFDLEGEDIPHSFALSMRDDFGIPEWRLLTKKVCLTHDQVLKRGLPENYDIKRKGSRYNKFKHKYGESVYELEALPEADISRLLTEAIDEVLDIDAFNDELDAEKEDAEQIEALRKKVAPLLIEALDEEGGGR